MDSTDARSCPDVQPSIALRCFLRFNDDEYPPHRTTLQMFRSLRLAESVPLANTVVLVAQYDPRNRLMRVAVDGATVARHTYDGEGVRTKRLDANGTIHYVGRRYERNVGNGGSLPDVGTTYIEAQLGPRTVLLAFRKGGQLTLVGTDHLGGTLATAAGTSGLPITGRLRYTPYGQGLGASGNFGTDRGFTGQTVDAMAGLYWFASRSYDPSIGRFVQPDTVVPDWTNPQALNRYAYALNNPLKFVDPSGHDPWATDPDFSRGGSPRLEQVSAAGTEVDAASNAATGVATDALLPQRYEVFTPDPARQSAMVVGIKDTSQGPRGAYVVRFDQPDRGTNAPHINVNPDVSGVPDPHWRISGATLDAVGGVGRTLDAARRVAVPVAIGLDMVRMGDAVYADGGVGPRTRETIGSIAGSWAGAAAGAWAGAEAGAYVGGVAGTVVEPGAGTVTGAAVGGIVGGLVGGISGAMAGSWGGESVAGRYWR